MAEVCTCPTCGHSHRTGEREISLYKGMVMSLWKVYRWCLEKNRHEFSMNEVRYFVDKVDYARFGDWKKFGGLVYSPKVDGRPAKGHYGLNLGRCEEFFRGEYRIPVRVWKNVVTGEIRGEDYRLVGEIPNLSELLDQDGVYVANYRPKIDRQTNNLILL